MNKSSGKSLFIIGLGICILLMFFPLAQITKEKSGVIEYRDYYSWGIHIYGTKNVWDFYLNPSSKLSNILLYFATTFLIAGLFMGLCVIYNFFTKPKVAPTFSWLSIAPLILSILFFKLGLDDIMGNLMKKYSVVLNYLASFYIFIFGIILMILSSLISSIAHESKVNGISTEKPHIAPSLILIAIGIIMFVYGLAATLLIYSEINKPLFNFASSNVQWVTIFSFISSIAYTIVGIISMIKGFIDYSMQKEPMLNEKQYTNFSIVFLILTWFVFPVIFGLFATLFGYIIYSKWNKNKGIVIMVVGIISTIISTILGIWSMQTMIK